MDKQIDVFISLHVSSGGKYGQQFTQFLKEHNLTSWICTSLLVGDEYRKQIVKNASTCKFFIPLINASWGRSSECTFEYNIAERTFRLSKTNPIILPIIIGGLDWINPNEFPEIYGIICNKNAIILESNNWEKAFKEIGDAIKSYQTTITIGNAESLVNLSNKFLTSSAQELGVNETDLIEYWKSLQENDIINLIKFLKKIPFNRAIDERWGEPAIHMACYKGYLDIVKYLVGSFGEQILEIKGKHGTLPIHAAANGGDLETIKYLVGRGVDINIRMSNGMTSLHSAAYIGNISVVEFLLSRGADKTKQGLSKTPYEMVKQSKLEKEKKEILLQLLSL